MTPVIPPDLHILQHSLGLDAYGRGEQYRNHFVTGEGSVDFPVCLDLVQRGLMTQHAGGPLCGDMDLFRVTPAGIAYVAEQSPEPPRQTRSERRYARWLEADCGMSFGDWLRLSGSMSV